eukprot:264963_1
MSFTDTVTYHRCAVVSKDLRVAHNRSDSYHSSHFRLTSSFWQHIISLSNYNESIYTKILNKYKLSKIITIDPIQPLNNTAKPNEILSDKRKQRIRMTLNYLATNYRYVGSICISNHFYTT